MRFDIAAKFEIIATQTVSHLLDELPLCKERAVSQGQNSCTPQFCASHSTVAAECPPLVGAPSFLPLSSLRGFLLTPECSFEGKTGTPREHTLKSCYLPLRPSSPPSSGTRWLYQALSLHGTLHCTASLIAECTLLLLCCHLPADNHRGSVGHTLVQWHIEKKETHARSEISAWSRRQRPQSRM